jgi:IstB-like ATP binding protein
MLNQQTIEKLYAMRMRGMADGFTQQQEDPQTAQLSFEERFALLVDRQWNWRQNRALERRLRDGRLQGPACVEDIDFRAARGLDKQVIRPLFQESDWVRRTDRRSYSRRQYPGPVGAWRSPDRVTGRFDPEAERSQWQQGRVGAGGRRLFLTANSSRPYSRSDRKL